MSKRPNKISPLTLNILSWNANGIRGKKHELLHFLQDHNIDVALIQETFLKPGIRISFPNYTVYRDDRIRARLGGTMILVKHSLNHYQPPPLPLVQTEATSIAITMANNTTIHLSSVYQQSGDRHPIDPADFRLLFGPNNQKSILGGDFNAKNVLWGNLTTNANGIALDAIQNQIPFNLVPPDEPTFIGRGRPDFLDIFLLNNINLRHDITVFHELSSDHLPVIFTLGNPADRINATVTSSSTDWDHFQRLLATTGPIPTISSTQDLDSAVNKLTADIQTALAQATTSRTQPVSLQGRLPPAIKEQIREKNRLLRRAVRTGDPRLKRLANQATQQVKESLTEYHSSRWESKVESLTTQDCSLWKMAKVLSNEEPRSIPAITHAGTTASSTQEKADLLADLLEDQFSPNVPNHPDPAQDLRVATIIRILNLQQPPRNTYFTTPSAVNEIIRLSSIRKAPGHDKITNKALKKLPKKQISETTNIINSILRLSYFPRYWKKAEVIMIKKPGSPSHEANSYRPISLLPGLGKIAEKVILEIVRAKSTALRVIPDEQFGFQPLHGTIHHTTKLAQTISNSFNKRHKVGAVFLDVSKAFDRVWHEGLVLKLIRHGYPVFINKLILSFVSDRTFQVRVDTATSEVKAIRAGVPQGSVLSPHLFNVFTADIPKMDQTSLFLYADDTAITAEAKSNILITNRLQRHLDVLASWFDRWRIRLNPLKTQAIVFAKGRNTPHGHLQLQGTRIQWATTVRYLGVQFDKQLVWKDQVCTATRKAKQLLGRLYPLLNRSSKLQTKTKLLIYNAIVRAGLTYACPTWCQLSRTRRAQVQVVQNKALRMITGAPWFVRNRQLHRDLSVPTIKAHMRKSHIKFFDKASRHPNPEVRNAFRLPPHAHHRYPRPSDLLSDEDDDLANPP